MTKLWHFSPPPSHLRVVPPPPPRSLKTRLVITPLCTPAMLFPLALQGAQRQDPGGSAGGQNILVPLYTAAEFCLETQEPVLQADS